MDSSSPRRRRDCSSSRSSPPKRRILSNCTTVPGLLSASTTLSDVDLHDRANTIVPVTLLSCLELHDITDDLLLEILLHVPAKTLHCAKSVSKRWLSLISAPSFARSYNLLHPFINILYFKLGHKRICKRGELFGLPILHDDMNKVSASMSGSWPLLSFDFIPPLKPRPHGVTERMTERLLTDMNLKGDCIGLVLLEAVYKDRTGFMGHYGNVRYIYYVCNPVTKQWVELPSISARDIAGFTCYYLRQGVGKREEEMTRIWANNTASSGNIIKESSNYNPNKIRYTVVSIIRDEEEDVFIISVFSSSDVTARWRYFRVPFPRGYQWMETHGTQKVIFSNGKFHWTGVTCIAAYDPFNKPHQCDIIPLPPMGVPTIDITYAFETYEGCIRVVTPRHTGRISVWELADYTNKVWVKIYDVEIDRNLRIYPQCFVPCAAGEKAYSIADRPKDSIMALDLRNASLQHVYTLPSGDNCYSKDQYFTSWLESYTSSPWPTPIPPLQRK